MGKEKVLELLIDGYTKEIETVVNYLANSIMLDGVRAEEIKKNLAVDVQEELLHASQLARRIKQLGGVVPGSLGLKMDQKSLQPPADTTDVIGVIKGVLAAEESAISNYKACARLAGDIDDYVTQDICIQLLTDEEAHYTQFNGFLKEYEKR